MGDDHEGGHSLSRPLRQFCIDRKYTISDLNHVNAREKLGSARTNWAKININNCCDMIANKSVKILLG